MFTNKIAAGVAAAVLMTVATPSQAVQTTFANFFSLAGNSNFYWRNNVQGNPNSAAFNTGQRGNSYSMANTVNNASAGTAIVYFNFLVGGLPTLILADWTFFGNVNTNTPATTIGSCPGPTCFTVQSNITGSSSFKARGTQNISGFGIIPNGTNLLSLTNYTGALTTGVKSGNSASLTGTDPAGGTIIFTSDPMFGLDFSTSTSRGFSMSLTGISQIPGQIQVGYTAKPGAALSSFRAFAGGSFSSDPSPILVPEPATWGMFIAGFAMVGFQVRRRRRVASVAA